VAKGQIFKFSNYAKCQNAVAELTWHFDRIGAFSAVIGSSSWNWENPSVINALKGVMEMDPARMRENIEENNVVLIGFARDVYERIYG
jgi:hypothetical protein